jgi:transposase
VPCVETRRFTKEACERINVVALDQHEAYAASVKEYCKNAKVVWDRFHIIKNFEEAVNEVRKSLHNRLPYNSPLLRITPRKISIYLPQKS